MNAEMLMVFFVAAIFLQQNVYAFNGNRIINGSATPDGEFEFLPRLTMLAQGPGLNKIENEICSSTIISKRHVLTAAHCVNMAVPVTNISDTSQVYRTPALLLHYRPKEKVVEVDGALKLKNFYLDLHNYSIQTKYYFHPSYTHVNLFRYDIAIIEFPEGTDLKIPPITLASNYVEKEGDMAIAAGYGIYKWQDDISSGTPETPAVLQNATVPVHLSCPYVPPSVTQVICSGTIDVFADRGDSGGPLMIKRNEKVYQIGIASSAARWSSKNITEMESFAFNVYTRISEECDWIEKITKGDAKCEPLPEDPNHQPNEDVTSAPQISQTEALNSSSNFATLNIIFLFFAAIFFFD